MRNDAPDAGLKRTFHRIAETNKGIEGEPNLAPDRVHALGHIGDGFFEFAQHFSRRGDIPVIRQAVNISGGA